MCQSNFPAVITSIINSYLQPEAIFCFGSSHVSHEVSGVFAPLTFRGYEQRHFSLLVVANEARPNAIAEVSDLVYVNSNGMFSVTVLLHSREWINKAPDKYRDFFARVVAAPAVYQAVEWELPAAWVGEFGRDFDAAAKAWEHRQVIIEASLQAENAIEHPAGEQVRAALLHQVAEQVCLGLIEVFMGYRPVHFALGYLFDLCGNFTPLVADIFPRHTTEEKGLFKLLASNPALLRHRSQELSLTDIELLQRRTATLHQSAALLISDFFEANQ
jgi:hypothetical protein